jgi:hypothetical protein
MSLTLKVDTNTVFKRKPIQSSELPDDQKQTIEAGKEFKIDSYTLERGHVRVFDQARCPLQVSTRQRSQSRWSL